MIFDFIHPSHMPPFPQIDIIGVVVIVWRVRGTRSPAIAEGPRDAGVPVEIW